MSKEQFESMISRFEFKDHRRSGRGQSAVTVNSVMLYWLNLLPNPYEAQSNPGNMIKKKTEFITLHMHQAANSRGS